MAPSLESYNNCQEYAVISLISSFYWYHLPWKEGHQMSSTQVIWNQLIGNFTNNIARYIIFNLDMTIWIKMVKDWYLYKSLFQLGKGLYSSGSKKTRSKALYQSLELSQKKLYQIFAFAFILVFGFSYFGTNFCAINLVVANSINGTVLIDSYRVCYYKIYIYAPQHLDK